MAETNRKQTGEQIKKGREHAITITERGRISVIGVNDVRAFDTESAELDTVLGILCIEGSELRLDMLDTEKGEAEINGKIDAVSYVDKDSGEKKGIFKRLIGC